MLNNLKSLLSGGKVFLMALLLTALIYPQWKNDFNTSISEPNLAMLENFANKDGIHVVAQRAASSNSIMYYRLSSSGAVINTTVIESAGGAEFPSISGSNNALYISYRLGSSIITKKYNYSTGNWDAQRSINIGSGVFRGLDNVYDIQRGLHFVYSADGSTHYYLYPTNNPNYTQYQEVSDQAYQGLYPTVTVSSNKVHVGFNAYGDAKTRDKNLVNNVWENTQTVASGSVFERVFSGSNKLFDFYHVLVPGLHVNLYVRERPLNQSGWSTPLLLNYSVHPLEEGLIRTSQTANLFTHVVYDRGSSGSLTHRQYDPTFASWSNEVSISSTGLTKSYGLSSVSNDLFVVFRDYQSNNLKFIHYDVAPLAPKNLTITQGGNNHPILSWSANTEPDISKYYIYRNPGSGWVYIGQTTSTSYEDGTLEYCTLQPPKGCVDENTYFYHVKAVDIGSNISAASNEVRAQLVGGGPPQKAGSDNPIEINDYNLVQNYPNPFNPTTIISYSIPQDAFVTLKVYDILGTEVAELVNQVKPAGYYEVNFNASSASGGLSSGVYIYRITATSNERILFTDAKRMLLMK